MKSIQYRNVPFKTNWRKKKSIDMNFIFALSPNYVIVCNTLTQVAIKTNQTKNNRQNYHIQYEKKCHIFLNETLMEMNTNTHQHTHTIWLIEIHTGAYNILINCIHSFSPTNLCDMITNSPICIYLFFYFFHDMDFSTLQVYAAACTLLS